MRIYNYMHARYRAFAPLSCLSSPRSDEVSMWRKWRWLTRMRREGGLVDPSVSIRCMGDFGSRLELGAGVQLDKGSILWLGDEADQSGTIRIGDRSYVGPYTFLGSCHDLVVGKDCLIGANCYLITVNHRTDPSGVPYGHQGYRGASIRLGSNVWLGSHVVVLPGVVIGDNAIIGAGAVVTKSIPAGETWVGVPAKRIKEAR